MNFISFSRLEREKGFDLLVRSLQSFSVLPGNFFLFGDGSMRADLFAAFSGNMVFEDCSKWSEQEIDKLLWRLSQEMLPNRVYFFSWQPKSIIDRFLRISHFSLMPSRCIESFGLSALESVSAGVSVIGFKKWGLVPFIPDSLAVPFASSDNAHIRNISEKIQEVTEKYSTGFDWESLRDASLRIASSYSEERWIKEVRGFLPEGTKKILLVSDYISALWGIESHITTIASALESHGYEVEIFGWDLPKNRYTRLLRMLGLVASSGNWLYAKKLRDRINPPSPPYQGGIKPDVIWFHSVSRFLGPMVVREGVKSGIFTALTYHDLGMWTPFASRMEREEDVPMNWDLGSFLSVSGSLNILTHIAIFFKFLQLSRLRKELQQIDIHLVPSEFLRKYVRSVTGIPEEQIITLEHFQK